MSDECSRGPVSSMPGSSHPLKPGAKCDSHPNRWAVKRIQGETDSFGCEYHNMCQQCADEYAEAKKQLGGANHMGFCGGCGATEQRPLFALRDWEEGSSGPLYYRCRSCKTEWHRRDAEQLAEILADEPDFEPFVYGEDD